MRASTATSRVEVTRPPSSTAETVAVPAGTDVARTANDWYAFAPGATAVNVRDPYGVVSVTSTGTSSRFVARTAT